MSISKKPLSYQRSGTISKSALDRQEATFIDLGWSATKGPHRKRQRVQEENERRTFAFHACGASLQQIAALWQ